MDQGLQSMDLHRTQKITSKGKVEVVSVIERSGVNRVIPKGLTKSNQKSHRGVNRFRKVKRFALRHLLICVVLLRSEKGQANIKTCI